MLCLQLGLEFARNYIHDGVNGFRLFRAYSIAIPLVE